MSLSFPTFDLTPAETASLAATVEDLLAEGSRLLRRPGPLLGPHDYAAALRLVRDAGAYSGDLLAAAAEEEEKGENKKKKGKKATRGKPRRELAYPASCALLKGDALRGLGRVLEAAAAYREAAAAYAGAEDGTPGGPPRDDAAHIDRTAAGVAARHLVDLEDRRLTVAGPQRRRARRAGGLWNAHDVAAARYRAEADREEERECRRGGGREADEKAALRGGGRGQRVEYRGPEPVLVVRSVACHKPLVTLVDRPAVRAAAGAVPAVVVDVALTSCSSRSSRSRHPMTTATRSLTSGGRPSGNWLPSGNPHAVAVVPPRSQEQPPRPLRQRESTSHDLRVLLQAQTGDHRHRGR